MKIIIKKIAGFALMISIIFGSSISVQAKEIYAMDDSLLYSGSAEECDTYTNYIRPKYMRVGSGYEVTGKLVALTYAYGDEYVRFDFETLKMTWVDGSKWKITNTDYAYKNYSGMFLYPDDAVRMFCPEFAETHSLIPEGAPGNFATVLEKARAYDDKRLGITRPSVSAEAQSKVAETYENFDATDYANRYPDVKNALGTSKEALWNHYQTFGKAEGRTAVFVSVSLETLSVKESFEGFNATDYANRYPDVKNALGISKEALWNHYQTFGKAEGRTALFG